MSKQDLYEVLGVDKTASPEDIKKRYRQLAMQFHPDRNKDAGAEEKFKSINDAYQVLSDPEKRAAYNQFGHDYATGGPQHSAHHANMNDMFSHAFNGGHIHDIFQQMHRQQQRVNIINISLEDAFTGRNATLKTGETITIPPGIRSNSRFSVGTEFYQINILPHHKFKRSNDDLLVDVDINSIEAMLGVDATITHLNSSMLQFTIPAGIQSGQIVRLATKGMKNPDINGYGDLLIRITVTTPKQLTAEQIAFLKTMQHRDTFNI